MKLDSYLAPNMKITSISNMNLNVKAYEYILLSEYISALRAGKDF
jgi:hypothetical protein